MIFLKIEFELEFSFLNLLPLNEISCIREKNINFITYSIFTYETLFLSWSIFHILIWLHFGLNSIVSTILHFCFQILMNAAWIPIIVIAELRDERVPIHQVALPAVVAVDIKLRRTRKLATVRTVTFYLQ